MMIRTSRFRTKHTCRLNSEGTQMATDQHHHHHHLLRVHPPRTAKSNQKSLPSSLSSSPEQTLLEDSTKILANGIHRRLRRTLPWTSFRPASFATLLPLNFLFVMLMIMLISTSVVTGAPEFDIEKLQEYNSLVSILQLLSSFLLSDPIQN